MKEAGKGSAPRRSCLAAIVWVTLLPISGWAFLCGHVTLASGDYSGVLGQAFGLALLALVLVGAVWRQVPRAARVVLALYVPLNLWTLTEAVGRLWL